MVQVDLASNAWDLQQVLTARFFTEYTMIEAFASQLVQVLDGYREIAILSGMSR